MTEHTLLDAVRNRMIKAEADLADTKKALGILHHELIKSEARVAELEKLCNDMEAEIMDYANALADAEQSEMDWARAYWEITKNLDMSELSDYDDELASNARERRTMAEHLLFPEIREEGDKR